MPDHADARRIVQRDLCRDVRRLQARSDRLSTREIDAAMAAIGAKAADYQFAPAAQVARSSLLSHAGSGHRAAMRAYLARMEDAIAAPADPSATQAILADIALRLR